jgi:hypothetical protein
MNDEIVQARIVAHQRDEEEQAQQYDLSEARVVIGRQAVRVAREEEAVALLSIHLRSEARRFSQEFQGARDSYRNERSELQQQALHLQGQEHGAQRQFRLAALSLESSRTHLEQEGIQLETARHSIAHVSSELRSSHDLLRTQEDRFGNDLNIAR